MRLLSGRIVRAPQTLRVSEENDKVEAAAR